MKVYAVSTSYGNCLIRARDKQQVLSYIRKEYGKRADPVKILPDSERDWCKAMGAYIHEADN